MKSGIPSASHRSLYQEDEKYRFGTTSNWVLLDLQFLGKEEQVHESGF